MSIKNMSLDEARRILGESSDKVSDELLRKDIDVARFLAEIFFEQMRKGKIHSSVEN